MVRVRVRQHVNPLSQKYSQPLTPPDWQTIYGQPNQPIHLDIGCARGRFVLEMAKHYPEINFLGVEIRQPLVDEANERRNLQQLNNLHYLFCNINTALITLLNSLPSDRLQWVSIQFPDPWFKQRHMKRRVVQPPLVNALANQLVAGGKIFLQSDIQLVAEQMRDRFLTHPSLQQTHPELWLEENPFPIPTEREIATQAKPMPVYRVLIAKS